MYVLEGNTKVFNHQYKKDLREMINNEGKIKNIQQTHFSYILDKLITQSGVGEILDIINCALTFIEVIFYILSTYTYPEFNQTHKNTNHIMNVIESIFLIYFIFHLILRFYISQSRFLFFFLFSKFS